MFPRIVFSLIAALSALATVQAQEPAKQRIETDKMVIEFDAGWLTYWQNKETGEKMTFPKPDMPRSSVDDRHYIPGPWWLEWKRPADPTQTNATWTESAKKIDDISVEFTQSAQRSGGEEVHGLQWSVNIPYDQIDSIRFPDNLAPERMAGPGALDQAALFKTWQLGNRMGVTSPRLRFYLIHGKTGGLLIYLDDPKFETFLVREYKKTEHGLIVTSRSVAEAPWKDKYTSGRWVFRQYNGGVNVAAQIYQDHLRAMLPDLKPLSERPTKWAQDLGFTFVGGPWAEPLPFPGKRRPDYNFSTDWKKSQAAGMQWLENCAKVLNPAQTMFYQSGWRYSPGVDSSWPQHSIDPYFAQVVGPARRKGFHVMLHYNTIMIGGPSEFIDRYLKNQSKLMGVDFIMGQGHDALRNEWIATKDDGVFGTGKWTQGVSGAQDVINMNLAFEGWRNMLVSSILSAVRATGADAVHMDVPDFWLDSNNALYGMTCQQGMGLFFKELRQTLDSNGLENVAIATEGLPHEIFLPYVDMAQMARDKTIELIFTGFYGLPDMFGRYNEKQVADLMKARAEQEARAKEKKFDPDAFRTYFSSNRELGEPAVKTLITGQFVRPYPHLGSFAPWSPGEPNDPNGKIYNRAFQAMRVWYAMSVDNVLYDSAHWGMFMDTAPYDSLDVIQTYRKWMRDDLKVRYEGKVMNDIDYGKYALARFWQDNTPIPVDPRDLQKGDINRYKLKDGRIMFVTRTAPTTLGWKFADGSTLAELDLFDGWKNDQPLMSKYAPTFLDNQLDQKPK